MAFALLTEAGLEVHDPQEQQHDELAARRAFAIQAGEVG